MSEFLPGISVIEDHPLHESHVKRSQPKRLSSQRRRINLGLNFAWFVHSIVAIGSSSLSLTSGVNAFSLRNQPPSLRRNEWIEKSIKYYSTVMRRNNEKDSFHSSQVNANFNFQELIESTELDLPEDDFDEDFVKLATKHYYARFLIKKGKWSSAEKLYRRIIDELSSYSEERCDNTKLAVSTLLLALHMQRTGDVKATRAVFLNFFRKVAIVEGDEEIHKCACSAKVLQAYALFEMKNGISTKSLEIIQCAVKMDEQLKPVLMWKQFRDAAARRSYSQAFSFRAGARKSIKDSLGQ